MYVLFDIGSYEIARSRRLIGQEETYSNKIREKEKPNLINQNKQAFDKPCCGNYHHP